MFILLSISAQIFVVLFGNIEQMQTKDTFDLFGSFCSFLVLMFIFLHKTVHSLSMKQMREIISDSKFLKKKS